MTRSIELTSFLLVLTFGLILPARARADEPASNIGSRLQLFLDTSLIESLDGVRLQMHPPDRREVVFRFDAPWEGPQSAYVSVLKDGKRFRMYYRGGGDQTVEHVCLAASDDGVNWVRPELGLYEFRKSRKNNVVYKPKEKSYREAHNFAPFIDANPAAKPEQRYKAVGLGRIYDAQGNGFRTLNALVSPDGIRWTKLRDEPVMTDGSFDSLNTVFWDTRLRKYVCYLRAGRDGKRAIRRCTSDDFLNWSEPEWIECGDGAPLEQFYTNGIVQYFREPGVYVGLPMRFVPERKTVGADGRNVDGLSDAVLISSQDGLNFDRTFMEAYIRPGRHPMNWGSAHGNNTPAWGILPTAEGELSIYWAEHYGGGNPRLVRGVVRTDGFASANAGYAPGRLVTRRLVFRGSRLVLNYATSAVGSVRVEVQNGAGKPLPGFTLDECDEVYGDELERTVKWKGRADLNKLAGQVVRLRVDMRDADIYSLRFAE
jgi:hypothetical protein